MSTTVIWTDWGDDDSIQLQRMWAGLDHIQVVHVTRWNSVMERAVDLAIANEKDTLLFCGHGSSYGLMAPKSLTEYAIHQMNTPTIQARNVIGISCYASAFAERVGLHGLFSGMFISNMNEAVDYCVRAEYEDIVLANHDIFKEINHMLHGYATMQECLSTLQATNTDNMVTCFNIQGINIFQILKLHLK